MVRSLAGVALARYRLPLLLRFLVVVVRYGTILLPSCGLLRRVIRLAMPLLFGVFVVLRVGIEKVREVVRNTYFL